MTTSVYLSNSTINAVVGTGGKKVRVKRVCSVEIPEGSLINGIITNEADLSDQLKEFWEQNKLPKKDVALVINSSQLVLKTLTMPKAKDRKIRELLPMEFGDVSDQKDPILDYMLESTEKNTVSVHAVMTDRSFIQGYLSLFGELGIKVSSISVARTCRNKLLGTLKQVRGKVCVVHMIDGTSINSMLWVNGTSVYATQRRVFCEAGTPQFGVELARLVNNIQQFAITQQIQEKIETVYLAGTQGDEFEIYRQAMIEAGTEGSCELLQPEKHIRMPKGMEQEYSRYLAELGNMIHVKQDINLVVPAKKKVKNKESGPKVWKRYVLPPLGFLLICGSVAGVMLYQEYRKKAELRELKDYINDPNNIALCAQADEIQQQIAEMSGKINQIRWVEGCIQSYPYMNSSVVMQLQSYAQSQAVELEIQSYKAEDGNLSVDAKAENVTLINQFIDMLEASGIFDDIQYSGYSYDEKTLLYSINVNCYLSEQAGR